ncbi:Sm-like ribonucleoprotein [Auriculariales sp. MPI-PUGE-AT-0066]|nr:Sm-like ribonucleoprotein [Auriculariales sp. MPI-PUGE-AT-0066]
MDSLIPFTTSGSLVDCVDKKMLVILRDGRKLLGVLRSYDQFANLVLEDTVERVYHGQNYADVRQKDPVYLVRGENVVLIGEIDLDVEDDIPLQQIPYKGHMDKIQDEDFEARKRREATKATVLYEKKGFTREGGEGDWY